MDKFCHSCAAPLSMPDFKGPAENYCKYCTDDTGKLKSRDEIKKGITEWFKSWQPDIDEQTALNRADAYMKSMPAWAED
jgi:hypothetical protein